MHITGTLITDRRAARTSGLRHERRAVKAANLPELNGSNTVYQLPVALVARQIYGSIRNADAQLNGFTMVWDEFELKQGVDDDANLR